MKQKRIKLIVKGKGILESLLSLREKKITRGVEAAGDEATERQLDAEMKSLKAIEAMGANADNPEGFKCALNAYLNALDEKRAWEQRAEDIKTLKKALNEEIEESEEESATE